VWDHLDFEKWTAEDICCREGYIKIKVWPLDSALCGLTPEHLTGTIVPCVFGFVRACGMRVFPPLPDSLPPAFWQKSSTRADSAPFFTAEIPLVETKMTGELSK
jgi:hypothetical protein